MSVTESITNHAPDALIVGPMKAGTSWLYEYLKTRSEVCLPRGVKETFYFDQRFESKSPGWYTDHFAAAESGQRIVEVAPTYFHSADVPDRVRRALGQIPIVITLRDPSTRAFSLYQHMRRYGFTQCGTFREAVREHDEILESSRYATCLERWQNVMGDSRVEVLLMEQLKTDNRAFAAACCEAIGLSGPATEDPLPAPVNVAAVARSYTVARGGRWVGDCLRSVKLYWVVESAKRLGLKRLFFGRPQTGAEKQSITPEDRRWFIDQIDDEINRLESMLGRDLSAWRTVPTEGADRD